MANDFHTAVDFMAVKRKSPAAKMEAPYFAATDSWPRMVFPLLTWKMASQLCGNCAVNAIFDL
jgi:hypothetical protein